MRTVGLTACALVAAAIVARILWLFTNRVPVLAHAENVDALGDTMPGDPLNPPEHPQGLQRMSPFHTADMRLDYEVAGKHYERDVETHSIDGLDMTAPDDNARRAALVALHQRLWEALPTIPVGQYVTPYAARGNVKGILKSNPIVFWNIEKD